MMNHRQLISIFCLLLFSFAQQHVYAQLSQTEFVDAVGALGLTPDAFAAAGISEADLVNAYQTVADNDAAWTQVSAHRDELRVILDAAGTEISQDSMDSIESAKAVFDQAVDSWRDTVIAPASLTIQSKLLLITSQSSSSLPAYLLVKQWNADELDLLSNGIAEYLREQRTGIEEESEAIDFYLAAMEDSDVIAAKVHWDVRYGIYSQRFTEQLSVLN